MEISEKYYKETKDLIKTAILNTQKLHHVAKNSMDKNWLRMAELSLEGAVIWLDAAHGPE